MASSELTTENLYYKVITNDLSDIVNLLDEDNTIKLIKFFENNYSFEYGYKSKKAINIYQRLESICNNNVLTKYFENVKIEYIYIKSCNLLRNLLISDYMCYNDYYFEKIIGKNKDISFWLINSSYKLVVKILKYKHLYYKIREGEKLIGNKEILILNCLKNTDDRVNKLVIKYINKENLYDVLKIVENKPSKYFLKFINVLNKSINLKNHFDKLLCLKYRNFKTFVKILKIYQNNIKIKNNNLNLIFIFNDHSEEYSLYQKYKILEELCIPFIFKLIQKEIFLKFNYLNEVDSDINKIIFEILDSNTLNVDLIINKIKYLEIYTNKYKYEICNLLSKKYGKEIYNKCLNNTNKFLVIFGNYYPVNSKNHLELIKINLVKSFLRQKIRKYVKNKQTSLQNNFKKLINEIKSYLPNENIPILSNGSYIYKLVKESFHSINPPIMFDINKKYVNNYISLKADGVNTCRLPSKINIKLPNIVKAEYIEYNGKELYLVYDINLPNLTYLERVKYLREIHPYNLKSDYVANNLSELINIIKIENRLENEWVNENKDYQSVWYPKAFIRYKGDIKELAKLVLNNSFNVPYLNYEIDGIILNCNGIDYKIKPKNLHTIDILYLNKSWYSTKNRKIKYNIINPFDIKLSDDTIYRCYPEDNNTYYIKDERYDKLVPNSLEIIESIRKSYFQLDNNNYYQKIKNITMKDLDIIKSCRNTEKIFLRSLDLDKSKSILDLCSGKGQVTLMLPNHEYYNLIDNVPIDNIKLNDVLNKRVLIKDLGELDLCEFKDNIWICLNGIWYWEDNFIKNVLKHKPKELIFNVHKREINWSNNESYIKLEDNKVKYYYSWCHRKECVENHVTIDNLIKPLETSGYICKKMYSNNENNLISQFELYYFRLK